MKTESFLSVDMISTTSLIERTLRHRAMEAVIWGMPIVNFDFMFQEMAKLGGTYNQVVYWSRLFDWKNQTLTPNPDVIYLMPFFNTQNGPVVIEIPSAEGGSLTGSIMDAWQSALDDIGPAGADKGNGGKYLILPPGYSDSVPEGFIALQCDTYTGYAILRSNPKSGSPEDIAAATAYGKRVKIYPLSREHNGSATPPETTFIDAIDAVFDSAIKYDISFFKALDRMIQNEPWLERDKVMIDQLRSVGIEKGKPFHLDEATTSRLGRATAEAQAWLEEKYPSFFAHPFYSGSRWALPAPQDVIEGQQTFFANPDSYPVSDRGVLYSFVYFSAKHLGAGQFYLMTIQDKDGKAFQGKSTYRLIVPASPPVNLYWSVTIYDRNRHTLIRELPWASRSSNTPELVKNSDGSVNIYFGPEAPQEANMKSNWIPTKADGEFEVLFRFYGPEKPLFDKTWVLPDVERTA